MKLSAEIRKVLWGDPFGEVYPKRDAPIPPVYDGRTAALRVLRKYCSELVFYRPGGKDPLGETKDPIPFSLNERDIHVEWPDDEEEMRLPALAFLATTKGNYDAIGMSTNVDEDSYNKYAPETVLIWMSEYVENFTIEIWAETKQQRRAMILGLEQALSPVQQMSGLRFVMPDYYGQLVCFSLQDREVVDDDTGTVLRRKAKLTVEMRFTVVACVPVSLMEPQTETQVDVNEVTGEEVQLETDIQEPDTDEG